LRRKIVPFARAMAASQLGKGVDRCHSSACSLSRSAFQFRKWQLIGIS